MDLRQLRYFIRIVEMKSLARAASELGIAQSALGWHLRNLEREVNVPLVNRHSRGIEPTPAGLLLHDRALEIMRRLDETKRELGALGSAARPRILLGTTPPMQRLFALVVADRSRADLPQANVMVVDGPSARLVDEVRAGRLDFCVAYDVEDHRGCARRELLRDATVLVERRKPGMRGDATVTLKEAARRPLVLPGVEHAFRRLVAEHAARHRITLNVAFESLSLPVVHELVEAGSAASFLPFSAVARDVGDRRLSVRRLVDPAITQTVWLYHAERRPLSPTEIELEKILKRALTAESRAAKRRWLDSASAARGRGSKPAARRKAS